MNVRGQRVSGLLVAGLMLVAAGSAFAADPNERCGSGDRPAVATTPLTSAADAFEEAGRYVEAASLLLEAARKGDAEERVRLLLRSGMASNRAADWELAWEAFRSALALAEALDPESLLTADCRHELGVLATHQYDNVLAADLLDRALSTRERLAPESLAVAQSLEARALLSRGLDDDATAIRLAERSLALRERLRPESLQVVRSLGALASAVWVSDVVRMESLLRRAVSLAERLDPDSVEMADALGDLGVCLGMRNEPSGVLVQERAAAVARRVAPGGRVLARNLTNLAVTLERQRQGDAEPYYLEALAILERQAPRSSQRAILLQNVASLVARQGRPEEAVLLLERAARLLLSLQPNGSQTSWTLASLAQARLHAGDVMGAERDILQALQIDARRGWENGHTIGVLGDVYVGQGDFARAADAYCESVEAMERELDRREGNASSSDFGRAVEEGSRQEALAHLSARDVPAAFSALERTRARGLLRALEERRRSSADGLAAEVRAEIERLHAEHDSLQATLAALDPTVSPEKFEATRVRLAMVRQEGEAHRPAVPRAPGATRRGLEGLDAKAALASLDPGTVALVYVIGESEGALFVLSAAREPRTLAAHRLPFGGAAILEKVTAFRRIVERGRSESSRSALDEAAGTLFEMLVEPARAEIAEARRVVISPDRSLHVLPFALLSPPRPAGAGALGLWKPLSVVNSITLLADLATRRRDGPLEARLAAVFGDPAYPSKGTGGELVRSALDRSGRDRSRGLTALPASRKEAAAIAETIGPGARLHLGGEASESRALALPPETRLVHFACHALLDEESPLDSSLVLTVPEELRSGEPNGFLQVWEIAEKLHLDADLVTMSACDTGLGRDAGSEGLVGLTRAFLIAGARSVVSSLWQVADESTARLMTAFYRELKSGKPKDVALQSAQRKLAEEGHHPFRWGAFEVVGDWR